MNLNDGVRMALIAAAVAVVAVLLGVVGGMA
jgi:hypothetical protein